MFFVAHVTTIKFKGLIGFGEVPQTLLEPKFHLEFNYSSKHLKISLKSEYSFLHLNPEILVKRFIISACQYNCRVS